MNHRSGAACAIPIERSRERGGEGEILAIGIFGWATAAAALCFCRVRRAAQDGAPMDA